MAPINYVFFKQPSKFWKAAKQLRYQVFVKGQGVPEAIELDDHDQSACHLIARCNEETVAVMRILLKTDSAKFGRIATHPHYRNQGIATTMVRQAIAFCHLAGITTISLSSQSYITQFYEKLGFKTEGKPFTEAGIPHIHMLLNLSAEDYCELPLHQAVADPG